MPISIEIVDEVLGLRSSTPSNSKQDQEHRWMLEFLDETVTAQEIIRRRIYQEVQDSVNHENPKSPVCDERISSILSKA